MSFSKIQSDLFGDRDNKLAREVSELYNKRVNLGLWFLLTASFVNFLVEMILCVDLTGIN
jgi:hypothetical protein